MVPTRRRAAGRFAPVVTLLLASSLAACRAASADSDMATSNLGGVDPALEAAARANLDRIAKEIDQSHLANYALPGTGADPFVKALKLEYANEPDQLERRFKVLASMVFFSAPEVATDGAVGRLTPFHGMDDAAFGLLMRNEDFVFGSHVAFNGNSPNGVRPFSVCETKYLIGISTGKVDDAAFATGHALTSYDAYAQAYASFAASCDEKDKSEWYNFRGLGGLRPTWLESNFSDRVLRYMLKSCRHPSALNQAGCDRFAGGRHGFRDAKNTAMALREVVYSLDPSAQIDGKSDEKYINDPNDLGVFVDDQDGDGVGEWLAPGPATLVAGAKIALDSGKKATVSADGASLTLDDGSQLAFTAAAVQIQSTGTFTGALPVTFTIADGTTQTAKVSAGALAPITRVDARWSADNLAKPDLGFTSMFKPDGCSGATPSPDSCELLHRFYSLIDRHENFYQTYSAVDSTSPVIASQPSPLVACSITLAASHQWDTAGTPVGGTAGFIFLMRIPYAQILVGDTRSIDTLGRLNAQDPLHSGPKVLALQDIYAGTAQLDMSKVWFDIATLSHNQFSTEHEISKFGSVPAEQIEGMLVVRRPAAMTPNTPPPPPPATDAGAGSPDADVPAEPPPNQP